MRKAVHQFWLYEKDIPKHICEKQQTVVPHCHGYEYYFWNLYKIGELLETSTELNLLNSSDIKMDAKVGYFKIKALRYFGGFFIDINLALNFELKQMTEADKYNFICLVDDTSLDDRFMYVTKGCDAIKNIFDYYSYYLDNFFDSFANRLTLFEQFPFVSNNDVTFLQTSDWIDDKNNLCKKNT